MTVTRVADWRRGLVTVARVGADRLVVPTVVTPVVAVAPVTPVTGLARNRRAIRRIAATTHEVGDLVGGVIDGKDRPVVTVSHDRTQNGRVGGSCRHGDGDVTEIDGADVTFPRRRGPGRVIGNVGITEVRFINAAAVGVRTNDADRAAVDGDRVVPFAISVSDGVVLVRQRAPVLARSRRADRRSAATTCEVGDLVGGVIDGQRRPVVTVSHDRTQNGRVGGSCRHGDGDVTEIDGADVTFPRRRGPGRVIGNVGITEVRFINAAAVGVRTNDADRAAVDGDGVIPFTVGVGDGPVFLGQGAPGLVTRRAGRLRGRSRVMVAVHRHTPQPIQVAVIQRVEGTVDGTKTIETAAVGEHAVEVIGTRSLAPDVDAIREVGAVDDVGQGAVERPVAGLRVVIDVAVVLPDDRRPDVHRPCSERHATGSAPLLEVLHAQLG